MNNLENNILDRIEGEKLTPKPKWYFGCKNIFIWIGGITSLLLASLAFALTIYMYSGGAWEIYGESGSNMVSIVLGTIPVFWLLLLIIFTGVLYIDIRKSKKGYKIAMSKILVMSVVVSVILGGVFFKLGVSASVDDAMSERAPLYKEIMNPHIKRMNRSDKGIISGVVNLVESTSTIGMLDVDNRQWVVKVNSGVTKMPKEPIIQGTAIIVVGRQQEETVFVARMIKRVGPGRGHMKKLINKKNIQRINRLPKEEMIRKKLKMREVWAKENGREQKMKKMEYSAY